MKVFRFEECHNVMYYTEVLAESIEEAIEIAKDNDWETDDCQPIETRVGMIKRAWNDDTEKTEDIEVEAESWDDISEDDEGIIDDAEWYEYDEVYKDNEAYNKYKIIRKTKKY